MENLVYVTEDDNNVIACDGEYLVYHGRFGAAVSFRLRSPS
jgi:hypothetical protein